jgi:hypothetical protein
MRDLFHRALTVLEGALRQVERQVPVPQKMPFRDGFVWRYVEKTPQQALVQKLARNISSLHAVDVLLSHGLLQEQGAMHRMLDEIHEDILFLAAALTNGTLTDRHQEFLAAFYAEEMHDTDARSPPPVRPASVPRKKIRAYPTRILSGTNDPSAAAATGATISSAYSGYIHAASPHTMEMYGGSPPRFHVSGIYGTPLWRGHVRDAWNYFYRGLLGAAFVAKAFGNADLLAELSQAIKAFETESGTDYYEGSRPPSA